MMLNKDKAYEKFQQHRDKGVEKIKDKWTGLWNIWVKIGIEEGSIEYRSDMLTKHFMDQFEDIEAEEKKILSEKEQELIKYTKKVQELTHGLGIDLNDILNKKDSEVAKVLKNLNADYLEVPSIMNEIYYYKTLHDFLLKIRDSRQNRLDNLKKKESYLCEILNEPGYSIDPKMLLKEKDLENLENHIRNLSIEKQKRCTILKNIIEKAESTVEQYKLTLDEKSSLKKLINNMNENSTFYHDGFSIDSNSKFLNEEIPIDNRSITKLRHSLNKLMDRRDKLVEDIDALRSEIQGLWQKFHITPNDQSLVDLVNSRSNYTPLTHNLLSNERNRCQKLKEDFMTDMIDDLRLKINLLWNECMFGQIERVEFANYFNDDNITNDLFEKHEQYVDYLKKYLIENENLLGCYKNWQSLWKAFVSFEEIFSDPNRFKNRNYSPLFEEQERRRLNSEIPKAEKQLKDLVNEFVLRENRQFTIEGLPLMDYIANKKNEYFSEKEKIRKDKQNKKEQVLKKEAHYGTSNMKHKTPVKQIKPTYSGSANTNKPNSAKKSAYGVNLGSGSMLNQAHQSLSSRFSSINPAASKQAFNKTPVSDKQLSVRQSNVNKNVLSQLKSKANLQNEICKALNDENKSDLKSKESVNGQFYSQNSLASNLFNSRPGSSTLSSRLLNSNASSLKLSNSDTSKSSSTLDQAKNGSRKSLKFYANKLTKRRSSVNANNNLNSSQSSNNFFKYPKKPKILLTNALGKQVELDLSTSSYSDLENETTNGLIKLDASSNKRKNANELLCDNINKIKMGKHLVSNITSSSGIAEESEMSLKFDSTNQPMTSSPH